MGFILLPIARILSLAVAPFNFVAVMITYAKREGFLKTVNSYLFNSALDVKYWFKGGHCKNSIK